MEGIGICPASGLPHAAHRLAELRFELPQYGQVTRGVWVLKLTGAPQFLQNLAFARLGIPHRTHRAGAAAPIGGAVTPKI